MYAPIQEAYMAEQGRTDLEGGNVAESTTEDIKIEKTTSLFAVDSFSSALTELDDESSPPTSSTNTFSEVSISASNEIVGRKQIFNRKFVTILVFVGVFVLVLIVGGVAYKFTNFKSGNTLYVILQLYITYEALDASNPMIHSAIIF